MLGEQKSESTRQMQRTRRRWMMRGEQRRKLRWVTSSHKLRSECVPSSYHDAIDLQLGVASQVQTLHLTHTHAITCVTADHKFAHYALSVGWCFCKHAVQPCAASMPFGLLS